jgi:hypothetical protein
MLLHHAEDHLAELQQVAVMHGTRLRYAHSINIRTVGAVQIAQQQAVVNGTQFSMLARHGRAGNTQRRFGLATDREPRGVDTKSAHWLVVGELPAEHPQYAMRLKRLHQHDYITKVLHISWRDIV